MATDRGISLSKCHCVFVQTNLDTRLAVSLEDKEILSDFKEKLCTEHKKCFPNIGKIKILAFKVKRGGEFFHLSPSMNMVSKVFENIRKNWFIYVDAVKVAKKKKRKRISEYHTNQSVVVKVVSVGDTVAEAMQNENETDNLASHPANLMDAKSGMMITSSGTTENKKKKQKKNSEDCVTDSSDFPANETNGDNLALAIPLFEAKQNDNLQLEVDRVDVISESSPNLRGERLGDDTLVDAKQTANEIEKFTDENKTGEHEATKDVGEEEAGEPKEDTLVSSDAPNVDSLQQRPNENLGEIGEKATKSAYEKDSLNIMETQVGTPALVNKPKDTNASFTPANSDSESNAGINNFGSSQKKTSVGDGVKEQGQVSSKNEKEIKRRVQPNSTRTKYLQSRVKKAIVNKNNKKTTVKNLVTVNKAGTMNFFKNIDLDSSEDESEKKLPTYVANTSSSSSDCSSDDGNDSDECSMALDTKRSLQEIMRRSRSYKEAKERASQAYLDTSDNDDESPALACVQKK